jgi:penicillin-insensitive murein endopeptidase
MKNLILFLFGIFMGGYNSMASESIGFYSKGKLKSAQSIFDHGTPVHKLFVSRDRLYTSDEMHNILTLASEFVAANYPDSGPLQVGDLSNREGGLATGHASHQNGLDGDVVYLRRNHYVQSEKSNVWDEDFVSGVKPTANFNTERNFALLKHIITHAPVERIFVDSSLKKALCQYALKRGWQDDPETIETLRRLRPEDLHRTHFHLRIFCPINNHDCTPQTAVPVGAGCDDLSILFDSALPDQAC